MCKCIIYIVRDCSRMGGDIHLVTFDEAKAEAAVAAHNITCSSDWDEWQVQVCETE